MRALEVITTVLAGLPLATAQSFASPYNNVQIRVRSSNQYSGSVLIGYHVGAGISYIAARAGTGSSFSFNFSATSAQLLSNDIIAGSQVPCYIVTNSQISNGSGPLECGVGDRAGYYDIASVALPNDPNPGTITFNQIVQWYVCAVQSFTYGWVQGTIVGSFARGVPSGSGVQNCTAIDAIAFVGTGSVSTTNSVTVTSTTTRTNFTSTLVSNTATASTRSNFTSTFTTSTTRSNFTFTASTIVAPISSRSNYTFTTLATTTSTTIRSNYTFTAGLSTTRTVTTISLSTPSSSSAVTSGLTQEQNPALTSLSSTTITLSTGSVALQSTGSTSPASNVGPASISTAQNIASTDSAQVTGSTGVQSFEPFSIDRSTTVYPLETVSPTLVVPAQFSTGSYPVSSGSVVSTATTTFATVANQESTLPPTSTASAVDSDAADTDVSTLPGSTTPPVTSDTFAPISPASQTSIPFTTLSTSSVNVAPSSISSFTTGMSNPVASFSGTRTFVPIATYTGAARPTNNPGLLALLPLIAVLYL